MAIAVRHQFVGALGRSVEADRVVDPLVLGERQCVIGAVHARTRRIHQMRHARMPASFEDATKCIDVVAQVRSGIFKGIPNPGLRRQVHDVCKFALAEQLRRRARIRQVHSLETKARLVHERRKPGFLQRDIVIGVEIVYADDGGAACQQRPCRGHADEASGTRDERTRRQRRLASVCSARSLAYLRKLANAPIAMCANPAAPSRNPSLNT